MGSKILYDTRTGEILRCQPEPKGSAGMPSFKALCRSARVPESEKQDCDTGIIGRDLMTRKCKNNYRIIEDEVVEKPKLVIDKNINSNKVELNIEVENIVEDDDFEKVKFKIDDKEIELDIGGNEIEFEDEGEYEIKCIDDRFKIISSIKVVV